MSVQYDSAETLLNATWVAVLLVCVLGRNLMPQLMRISESRANEMLLVKSHLTM